MTGYRGIATAVVCLLAAGTLCVPAASVSADLRDAMTQAGPGELVPVVVLMDEFPDRDALLAEVRGMNRAARRAHVVARLQALAERSQRSIRAALAIGGDEVQDLRVLWGVNGVSLRATPAVIARLASVAGVRRISRDSGRGQPAIDNLAPVPPSAGIPAGAPETHGTGPTGGDISGPNPDATVRGEVTAMGAEQVWEDLGYTGAGVIVAVIDTGVYPETLDIADHIWTNLDEIAGNGIDDDGNGHIDDTWGWDFCNDDNDPRSGNHGTQVAGQIAGDGTDGIVTGMAPDAEIMVIGIDCSPPDSIGWLASQYAIENGADIINLSFIWPWTEDTPDFEGWRRQMDTQLAAGVIHASAAGNDGADTEPAIPYNVSTPANCPAPWIHPDQTIVGGVSSTLTVGNIDWNSDVIASSSSRGPSAWEDIVANTDPTYPWSLSPEYFDYPYENGAQMGLIKPDVSAYGNGTTSICPGSTYCSFSGTSSATPHVAGAMALMLQANAEATPAEIAEALMTTAQHRGDPGKNNIYGTGLIQAYPAVLAVESTVVYLSHTVDDGTYGNGDGMIDPGERFVMPITVESRTDSDVVGMEAILSTSTPGVTIHEQYATYPTVPARGTAESDAPHFSVTIDPGACSDLIVFDLELRYDGKVRRSSFKVRVGDVGAITMIDDDFESAGGWTSDPGTASDGAFVREDPVGVTNQQSQQTNPEDDTSNPGTHCWVTGSGGGPKVDSNDVDDGYVILRSPPFGQYYMLSLNLSYDRFYYDNGSGGDFFKAEVSDDGGANWITVEHRVTPSNGWGREAHDLLALFPSTDDMRVRFVAQDGSDETVVEAAVDEVLIEGIGVSCQPYTPAGAQAPNPVGDTLSLDLDPHGHALLTWDAPPVDGGHDAATLYRIERATSPAGPFAEAGSATQTQWTDIDAAIAPDPYYYRVVAENAGGVSE